MRRSSNLRNLLLVIEAATKLTWFLDGHRLDTLAEGDVHFLEVVLALGLGVRLLGDRPSALATHGRRALQALVALEVFFVIVGLGHGLGGLLGLGGRALVARRLGRDGGFSRRGGGGTSSGERLASCADIVEAVGDCLGGAICAWGHVIGEAFTRFFWHVGRRYVGVGRSSGYVPSPISEARYFKSGAEDLMSQNLKMPLRICDAGWCEDVVVVCGVGCALTIWSFSAVHETMMAVDDVDAGIVSLGY
jgi:hypothetical protein